jgi:hypothetical protein
MRIINKRAFVIVLIVLILIAILIVSQYKIVSTPSLDGQKVVFKHSSATPLEIDGFEASEIEVNYIDDEIMVYTKIKNNTSEVVNGFFIEIELLDESNNHITLLAHTSKDKINPGQTIEFICASSLPEKAKIISKAKLITLQKNSEFDFVNQPLRGED